MRVANIMLVLGVGLCLATDAAFAEDEGRSQEQHCSSSEQCEVAEYCRFPDGECGAKEASGTCSEKPEICTMQYDPVCGCDGKTYSSDCSAAAKGISINSKGECLKK